MTEPTRRMRVRDAVHALFLAVALGFGAAYVYAYWDETRSAFGRMDLWAILAALAFAAVAQLTSMLSWRDTLADLGHRLPLRDAARVHYLSQLGKYVPGSVWQLVALVELGRRHHVGRRELAVSGLLTLLVSLTTAALVGGLLLLIGVDDAREWVWLAPVLCVAAILGLHPRTAAPLVDSILRLLRQAPLDRRWSGRGVLRVAAWQVLTWLCLGLHCWVLVIGLGATAGESFAAAVGGFAIAYAAGVAFLPAPSGVGVREAVLAALLAGTLDAGGVLVVVVVSRVALAVLDGLFGVTAMLLTRSSARSDGAAAP